MKTCKNCKWFERISDKICGKCKCEKFVYDGFQNLEEKNTKRKDIFIYGDSESYAAYFIVCEEFGCIHWEVGE